MAAAAVDVNELGSRLASLQLLQGKPDYRPEPDYRFVSLDLETTSLMPSKGRIIEIAAVDIASGEFYETLINPAPVKLSKKTCGITGIRACEVVAPGVPGYKGAFQGFMDFVNRCKKDGEVVVLVAHNGARFDFLYLRNECARNDLHLPDEWLFVDTLLLAQHYGLREEIGSLSQDAVRAWLKVPEPMVKHRALPDAQVLAALFPRLLDYVGSPTMAELMATKKRMAGRMHSVEVNIQMDNIALDPQTTSSLHKMLQSLLPDAPILLPREFVRYQLEGLLQLSPCSSNNYDNFKMHHVYLAHSSSTPPAPTPSNPSNPASTPGKTPTFPFSSPKPPVFILLQGVKLQCGVHKPHAYKEDGMTPSWKLLMSGETLEATDALVAFGMACDALTRQVEHVTSRLHSTIKAFNGNLSLKVALRTKLHNGTITLHTGIHNSASQAPVPIPLTPYTDPASPDHLASVRSANVDALNATLKRHATCDLLLCPEFVWSSGVGYGVKLTAVHVFLHKVEEVEGDGGGSAAAAAKAPKARTAPARAGTGGSAAARDGSKMGSGAAAAPVAQGAGSGKAGGGGGVAEGEGEAAAALAGCGVADAVAEARAAVPKWWHCPHKLAKWVGGAVAVAVAADLMMGCD